MQLSRQLVAGLGRAGKTARDDPAETRPNPRFEDLRGFELAVEDLTKKCGWIWRFERKPTGREPVKERTDREDVGPLIGRTAINDLGCHVRWGSDEGPGHRETRFRGEDLGDAKIHQLELSGTSDHDVLRLQVAVNDVLGVGVT